jgi:putative membrane protein
MASEGGGLPGPLADTDWRALEPASLAVNLLPDLWRTLKSVWPLLLVAVAGGGLDGTNVTLLALFFGFGAWRTVSHFLTVRYRWRQGRLEIRSGWIARQRRTIDPARIQNVEIVQGPFHKLAGLVELRVETAGESGAEGLLSAISVAEAEALRERLYATARPSAPGAPAQPEAVYVLGVPELLGYGMSEGRVGAALLVAGVLFEWGTLLAPAAVRDTLRGVRAPVAVALALFALSGAYTVSVLAAVVRHYGFQMVRTPRGLRIESGLLTTRGVEIPLAKVQAARVEEPLVRRLMGYASVHVETAAMGAPTEPVPAEGFVPMVAHEDVSPILGRLLPHLDADPRATTLRRLAPAALARSIVTHATAAAFVAGLLAWLTGSPLALLVTLLGPLVAWADWSAHGWWLAPRHLLVRRGFFRRTTWVLPRDKIQSVHRLQGPLQRVLGLAAVDVWAAGTRVVVPDLTEADAARMFAELST